MYKAHTLISISVLEDLVDRPTNKVTTIGSYFCNMQNHKYDASMICFILTYYATIYFL